MDQFVRDFIVPLAQKRGWKRFCEIGASEGKSTDQLLKLPGISHTIVDPGLDADLVAKYAADKRVRVLRDLSLEALPKIKGPYDCFLIDGDHNWFTVFNELNLIRQRGLLRPGGMIFFHDVDWPYGRRDMYYQPETVPAQHRLEFQRKGIHRGQSALADSGGRNAHLSNAVREGGPRNGVLTAIEDFLAEHPSDYRFCRIRVQHGLGIFQSRSSDPADGRAFQFIRIAAAWQNICAFPKSALRDLLSKAVPNFMRNREPVMVANPRPQHQR
jgi:hypothetical protein